MVAGLAAFERTQGLSNVKKPKTKKILNQEALTASLDSRWDEAIALNDEILDRFPRDAEALNRKGRAYMELGKMADAREAYSEALKADPANMIARRNLQRLETIYHGEGSEEDVAPRVPQDLPRGKVFVEEIGKTWIDDLAHPAENEVLAHIAAGDKLKLIVRGERVFVLSMSDVELGQVDQTIGSRMAKFMENGHEFEVYALGLSQNSLRFIIQEVARAEGSEGIMTFPKQVPPHLELLREREQLSLREEGDFNFGEDDEDEDDLDVDEEEDDEEDDTDLKVDDVEDDEEEFVTGDADDDEEEPEE